MIRRCLAVALAAFFACPAPSLAQANRAGVVTTLEGNVTAQGVARATPTPVTLKFKDDVFHQDRIITGDRSLARMLLGGKAVVTVRERSVLTITELPNRSVVELTDGKFALAVARERMKPGESIEIRTPNAVAGVRGTVVITEVSRATAQAGAVPAGIVTSFYVLRGTIDASAAGQPGGPTPVGTLQRARFAGTAPMTTVPISPDQIGQIVSGLQPSGKSAGGAGQDDIKTQAMQTAAGLVQLVTEGPSQPPFTPTTLTSLVSGETPTLAPINPITNNPEVLVPPEASAPCSACRRFSGVSLNVSGSPFQSFSGSFVSDSPLELLGFDASTVTHDGSATFIDATNASVALAGPLAVLVDTSISTTGNFMTIDHTTLATTGGTPLIDLDPSSVSAGASFLAAHFSTLTLSDGLLTTLGGTVSSGAGNDFFLLVNSTLTATGTTGDALIRLLGTTASAGFHFTALVDSAMTLGLSPLLLVDGGGVPGGATLTALNNILFLGGASTVTSDAAAALLTFLNGASVTATNFDVVGIIGTSSLTLTGGGLLAADASDLTGRTLLFLAGTLTSTGTGPLMAITNGAEVTSLLDAITMVAGSSMSLNGALLLLTGATLSAGDDGLQIGGSTLTSANLEDLLRLSSAGVLNVNRDLVHVQNNGFAFLDGGVAEVLGSTLTTGRDFLHVVNDSYAQMTQLLTASGSSVTIGRDLAHAEEGGTIVVLGDLMSLGSNNTVSIGGRLGSATAGGTVIATGETFEAFGAGNTLTLAPGSPTDTIFGLPVRQANGGFVSIGPVSITGGIGSGVIAFEADGLGSLVSINPIRLPNGPFMTFDNPGTLILSTLHLLVLALDSIATSQPIFPVGNALNIFISALEAPEGFPLGQGIVQIFGPVIKIHNGSVLNGASGNVDLIEIHDVTVALGGALLELGPGTLDNSGGLGSVIDMSGRSLLKTFSSDALIHIVNGNLVTRGSLIRMQGDSLTDLVLALSGSFLEATGASIGHPVGLGGSFASAMINVNEGTIVSRTFGAFVKLVNSSLTVAEDFVQVGCGDSCGLGQILLKGSLLETIDSSLSVGDSLVFVTDEGKIISTATSPFVSLTNGLHSLGTTGSSTFYLAGSTLAADTDPDASPLALITATDQPLVQSGVLFDATTASITSGNVSFPEPFVTIDRALVAATAPLFHLKQGTSHTHHGDYVGLISNAKLSAILPGDALVKLDASSLTLHNGSIASVTGGSFLSIVGNLLHLTNSSSLAINSGALVTVIDGVTGSLFRLTGGSLGVFGAGSNTLSIANNAPLCGGCSLVTNIPNLGGVKVLLRNGALATNVVVAGGFTPFAGGTPSVSGTSGAVLVLDGPSSKIILRP